MSTTLVETHTPGKRAFELAKFVAEAVYPADAKAAEAATVGAASSGQWTVQPPRIALSADGDAFMSDCRKLIEGSESGGKADFAAFLSRVLDLSPQIFDSYASDAYITGAFTLMFSTLSNTNDESLADGLIIRLRDAICGPSEGTVTRPALRIFILGNLFNFLQSLDQRHDVFLCIVDFAARTGQLGLIREHFDAVCEWKLSVEQSRAMFERIAAALEVSGDSEGCQAFMIRYLKSLEGEPTSALVAAKQFAVRTALGYIKAPAVSQRSNLIDLQAITVLRDDPEYSRLYELLRIFSSENLAAYTKFHADNSDYIARLGIDHEQSMRTMRLLSLCSVASANEMVPYTTLAEALEVPLEDVEKWVVEAIALDLIDGRMDQMEQVLVVRKWTERVFDATKWVEMQGKLESWRDNVAALLTTIRAGRERAGV